MVMGSQSRVWSGPELNASTSNLRLEKSGHEDLQSILNTMLQNEYIESFVYLLHQSSGWIPTITIPLKYMDSSTYINVTSFTHERIPSKGLLDSFPSPPQSHIEMWVDRWWNRSLGVPIFFKKNIDHLGLSVKWKRSMPMNESRSQLNTMCHPRRLSDSTHLVLGHSSLFFVKPTTWSLAYPKLHDIIEDQGRWVLKQLTCALLLRHETRN